MKGFQFRISLGFLSFPGFPFFLVFFSFQLLCIGSNSENCWNSVDFHILEPAYTPKNLAAPVQARHGPLSPVSWASKSICVSLTKAVQIASANLVIFLSGNKNCYQLIIICDSASMISNGGATKARGFTISWVATPEDECGIKGKLGLSFAPGKNCTRGVETWSRSMCGNSFSCCTFISRHCR